MNKRTITALTLAAAGFYTLATIPFAYLDTPPYLLVVRGGFALGLAAAAGIVYATRPAADPEQATA